jgi:hypothetical protein
MPSPVTVSNLRSLTLRKSIWGESFQTQQRSIHIKAILAQNGITDLAALGKLQLGEGRNITPTPGILTPTIDAGINLYEKELLLPGVILTHISSLNGVPSDIPVRKSSLYSHKLKYKSFSAPVFPFADTRQNRYVPNASCR